MKERQNRPRKGQRFARSHARLGDKPAARPGSRRPPPDLVLLNAVRAWASGRGERATEAALGSAGPERRYQLRGAFDRLFRHYARLGWALNSQGQEPNPDMIWAAATVVLDGAGLEEVARAIAVTSQDVSRIAGLLGRVSAVGLDHPDMPEAVRLECPAPTLDTLKAAFGDRAASELRALNLPAPADIRVNSLKADPEGVAAALLAAGVAIQAAPFAPLALRAKGHPDLAATPAFEAGLFEIQDEGSQLVALLTDGQPSQQVLDFCAGAGGKTLALAASMKNRGHLVAADTSQRRLTRAKLRLKRGGVENAERILLGGPDGDAFLKRRAGWFDRVLVDAPCSGTGAWRRHPETKWREDPPIEHLTRLQGEILSRAARLVKRGGRLIYATCSLLPAENEVQAEAFQASHPQFRSIDAAAIWEGLLAVPWPCAQRRYLKLTPAQHGTDGFFVAIFERTA